MALKKKVTWKWIFPGCFSSQKPALPERRPLDPLNSPQSFRRISVSDLSDPGSQLSINDLSNSVIGSNLYSFTLSELKSITRNFSSSNVLGEGGFGPVYKGFIDDKLRHGLKPQSVAVKVLDLDGSQGHREWLAEVIFLGQLRHPNLVKLIGYCCEDEQRVLVYEYLARGNLENHLFRKYSIAMPWSTRIKIALGAAKGLSFLHEEEKPVIYRDFKASNILLDSDFTAKLSDFGLAKDGPAGDDTHVTTRVMGTHGYAAPEYVTTGHLTMMSDVYSFGVVLLELLTGRRSMDKKRPSKEQSLVDWASPLLRDPRKLDRLMDPRLEGQYSIEGANRAAALAHRCLAQRPKSRPTMNVVVKALERIMELKDDIMSAPFVYVVSTDAKDRKNDFEKDQTKKGDIEAEEEEKKVKVKEDVNHLGQKKVQRNKNKNGRKNSRSRAIHSDTALYRTPLTGVNPTKYQRRRP